MANQYSPAVERLIQDRMASGRYASEEALLVEALRSLDESDEELRAIEQGLASFDTGNPGVSLEEAFDQLRKKNSTKLQP